MYWKIGEWAGANHRLLRCKPGHDIWMEAHKDCLDRSTCRVDTVRRSPGKWLVTFILGPLVVVACTVLPQPSPSPTSVSVTSAPTEVTSLAAMGVPIAELTRASILTAVAEECATVQPIRRERFKAGDSITGPAILYPDKSIDTFAMATHLILPLSDWRVALAVYSDDTIVIPDMIEVSVYFAPLDTTPAPGAPLVMPFGIVPIRKWNSSELATYGCILHEDGTGASNRLRIALLFADHAILTAVPKFLLSTWNFFEGRSIRWMTRPSRWW